MTDKKTAQQKAAEAPPEFDWLSLAQPTPEPDNWEAVQPKSAGTGPWWVRDEQGNEFATHVLVKGLTPLDESPFDRSGDLRAPKPGGIDTAPAE